MPLLDLVLHLEKKRKLWSRINNRGVQSKYSLETTSTIRNRKEHLPPSA